MLDELADHGVPLDILQQAVPGGGELDAFDLVAHVAFNQKPPDAPRAGQQLQRDVFGHPGEQAQQGSTLLEKFADHGGYIEDARSWIAAPDQFGSKQSVIRRGIFGGIEQYTRLQAVSKSAV